MAPYQQFNKKLTATRYGYLKQFQAQQKMSAEELDAQAAGEERQAREAEEQALAANKIELERMAKKR